MCYFYIVKPKQYIMNSYNLHVGGKVITTKGCNLKTAIENEGFVIATMEHEHYRKPNGRYYVRCVGNVTIHAEWVEKVKRLNQ